MTPSQPPVFPKMTHHFRIENEKTIINPKLRKRDKNFSKSRDQREDRGERQIKTMQKAQTFPH